MHFSLLIMKAHYINIYDCSFLRVCVWGGGSFWSLVVIILFNLVDACLILLLFNYHFYNLL